MVTMKRSGYNERVRRETALAAFKYLHEKLRQVREDGTKMHRHKEEGAKERHNAKISLKSSWFEKKRKTPTNSSNPPYIPASPLPAVPIPG